MASLPYPRNLLIMWMAWGGFITQLVRAALGFAACQSKKAQQSHSPGQRPGYFVFIMNNAPCKGNTLIIRLLPFQGVWFVCVV